MPNNEQVVLCVAEGLSLCDPDLIAHNVSERDHLSNRVLDLNARVHLHEIEFIILIEEKLHSTRARIAQLLASRNCGIPHLIA